MFGRHLGLNLCNRAGEGIRQVVNHNAIGLCPCRCEMDGLVKRGTLLWVEVLEATREQKFHIIVIHLAISHVRQQAQEAWIILSQNLVHVDTRSASSGALVTIGRAKKVTEGDAADVIGSAGSSWFWGEDREIFDGQELCVISVGGDLENTTPTSTCNLRRECVGDVELDHIHIVVEDVGNGAMFLVTVLQPSPMRTTIHAVFVHLAIDDSREDKSQSFSSAGVV